MCGVDTMMESYPSCIVLSNVSVVICVNNCLECEIKKYLMHCISSVGVLTYREAGLGAPHLLLSYLFSLIR